MVVEKVCVTAESGVNLATREHDHQNVSLSIPEVFQSFQT